MKYKVNEIFHSLQGEGFNQGKEAIFIRLAGCNLSCNWCDTNHHTFTQYSVEEIMADIARYNCISVILTGGEPSIHALEPLLHTLKASGYWVAIETNGTSNLNRYDGMIDYIALSPKSKVKQRKAHEVRVVNHNETADRLLSIEKEIRADDYYVSPLDVSGKMNIKSTLELVAEVNQRSAKKWRISLQLHKLVGIQ